MYTVELYKQDRRVKGGERLDRKVDHSTADRAAIAEVYAAKYPAAKGYRFEIHETYVLRKNLMGGAESRNATIRLVTAHLHQKPTGACRG